MIATDFEYRAAQEELGYLRSWLANLASDPTAHREGFTAISVQAMIVRVTKEIVEYEAKIAAALPDPPRPA